MSSESFSTRDGNSVPLLENAPYASGQQSRTNDEPASDIEAIHGPVNESDRAPQNSATHKTDEVENEIPKLSIATDKQASSSDISPNSVQRKSKAHVSIEKLLDEVCSKDKCPSLPRANVFEYFSGFVSHVLWNNR